MENVYLPSKQRYEILDGLRGVAAIMVVIYHLLNAFSTSPVNQMINHGYLAVDFFFLLSGFVIGYAYDDRWNRMSLGTFFKRRLVRLHPMVIMGTLVGGVLFYFREGSIFPLVAGTQWWTVVVMMLLGFAMIPARPLVDPFGQWEAYPLNGPAWSLLWEYIANILYALVFRHLSKTMLAIFVVFAAFLTLNLALNWDILGWRNPLDPSVYSLDGGFLFATNHIGIAATRLLYPFFMGLLLSRVKKYLPIKAGFWWCSITVIILLAMPRLGAREHVWVNGVYESFAVLLCFPLVVLMGAGSQVSGKSIEVCKFLGNISYPLYITHVPLAYTYHAWIGNHPDAPFGTIVFLGISVFILMLVIAYASLKLYDIPVREWLKEHWLHKKVRTKS